MPEKEYVYQLYPKWLYAKGGRSVIVATAEAHQAQGEGWFDSPVDAEAEPTSAEEAKSETEPGPDVADKPSEDDKPKRKKKSAHDHEN
jgi:hypothetical protein